MGLKRGLGYVVPACGLALAALLLPVPLAAQRDSLPMRVLDPVVVTAERAATPLSSSTSAVSQITAAQLRQIGGPTLAGALEQVPGFAVLDADGSGWAPQLVERGFYGGGQAEYVVVLINGVPISQLQTGLVPWDVLPPASVIDHVEVVRGGESALHGDAALGAVINIVTRSQRLGNLLRWQSRAGTFGSFSADASGTVRVGGSDVTAAAAVDRIDGFRRHAERDGIRAMVDASLLSTGRTALTLGVRSFVRAFDEPGPLLASLLDRDRAGSDDLFRFDHTHDASSSVILDGHRQLGAHVRLTGSVAGELRNTDAVQTLALAPGFGDTQDRVAADRRGLATAQLEVAEAPLPGAGRLIVGGVLDDGHLDSRYYAVASGDEAAYRASDGRRGPLDASGTGSRSTAAIFGEYTVQLGSPVRLTVGSRYDWLRDTFNPVPDGPGAADASHAAFSPKAGLNFRYLNHVRYRGNLYLTAGRSFKAPTLDQLFDQRPIPIPVPPYTVTTSNPLLRPQHGANLEAGVYQEAAWTDALRATASLSVYQMEMTDELDFDVQSLRYLNIGKSRHRGVETGVVLSAPSGASLFVNYTLQSVRSQSGDNNGKYLKAIPRTTVSVGATAKILSRLEAGATVTGVYGAWLDDANTVTLPGFTRVDARMSYPAGAIEVVLEARNLFDLHYNTTGYLDPAGTGEAYFYPAAGRTLSLGLRGGW
ncbi:MAG: TonB-dependent receptor [Gemmatimonadales bacterium]